MQGIWGTAFLVTIVSAMVMLAPATSHAALTITSKLSVAPAKMGTERQPRGVLLSGDFEFKVPAESEKPIVTRGHILLPRGIVLNGGTYPTCARQRLKEKGPKGCPPRSIVGSGLGHDPSSDLTPSPGVTFINGGARRVWAYTVYYHPTLVKEVVEVSLKPLRSRKWSYELGFTVPRHLRIVAGVPIVVPQSFTFRIGKTKAAPRYVATTAPCPNVGFRPYRISVAYLNLDSSTGEAESRGRLLCRQSKERSPR